MLQRKSIIIGVITLALYGTIPAWSYNNPAFIRGKDSMATGDWDGAVSAFGEALGMNPTDPEALSLRGACFYKMGNYKLAIEDLDNSLNYAPNNLRGLLLRGTCHAQLGHDAMAIIDYEQAIRMDPDLAKKFFAARSNNGAQQNDSIHGDAALSSSLTGQKPDGSEGLNLFAIQDYKDAMTNVYPNGFVDMDNAGNDTIKNRGSGNTSNSARRGSQRNSGTNQTNNQRNSQGNQRNNLATNLGSTRGPGFKGDYGSPFGAGDNREGATSKDATFVGLSLIHI